MTIYSFSIVQCQETNNLVATVLDMQPRMAGGGGAKSSDDIVYELAATMLTQIGDKLDIEEAKKEIFQVLFSCYLFNRI